MKKGCDIQVRGAFNLPSSSAGAKTAPKWRFSEERIDEADSIRERCASVARSRDNNCVLVCERVCLSASTSRRCYVDRYIDRTVVHLEAEMGELSKGNIKGDKLERLAEGERNRRR